MWKAVILSGFLTHAHVHTHRASLDENHSGVGEDDGQVADLGVRLVLVCRP